MSPVISATELIDHLIIDLLERLKDATINVLLDILLTMLCDECEDKRWCVLWKREG